VDHHLLVVSQQVAIQTISKIVNYLKSKKNSISAELLDVCICFTQFQILPKVFIRIHDEENVEVLKASVISTMKGKSFKNQIINEILEMEWSEESCIPVMEALQDIKINIQQIELLIPSVLRYTKLS
jgi:hypothetical protein